MCIHLLNHGIYTPNYSSVYKPVIASILTIKSQMILYRTDNSSLFTNVY